MHDQARASQGDRRARRPAVAPKCGPPRSAGPSLARWLPGAALAGGLLATGAGCSNVPPFVERSYIRAGIPLLFEPLTALDARSDGPYPALSGTLGTFLETPDTRATALEVEVQAYLLNPGGDLDGYGFRYSAGARDFWNMDGRLRPNVGYGGSWTDFRLKDQRTGRDPAGAGAYADMGLDWMLTATFGVGARLRENLRYEQADKAHGLKLGNEFSLSAFWRF